MEKGIFLPYENIRKNQIQKLKCFQVALFYFVLYISLQAPALIIIITHVEKNVKNVNSLLDQLGKKLSILMIATLDQ